MKLRVNRDSGWWFLLPGLLLFAGWQLYPILRVLVLSFTDYHFRRSDPAHFVGLRNFTEALADPLVHAGFLRALVFTAVFLPGMVCLPLLAAVLLDRVRSPRLAAMYRLILLLPAMIPGPLVFVLWKWMYSTYIGPINYVLVDVLHLFDIHTAPQWMAGRLAFPAIAVMEWWWGIGFHTMLFLAGLANIPKELYEAARMDGAGEWTIFWRITFPRLYPVMLVLVVLRFGSAMAVIDEFLIFGSFKPDLNTYTWTVYMWDVAFNLGEWNQAYAAAIGWLGAFGMLAVTAALFWLFRSRD